MSNFPIAAGEDVGPQVSAETPYLLLYASLQHVYLFEHVFIWKMYGPHANWPSI